MKQPTKDQIQRMILKELRWQGKWLIKSAGRMDDGMEKKMLKTLNKYVEVINKNTDKIEKLEKRLRKLEKKK